MPEVLQSAVTCLRATCAGFRESTPTLYHGRRACRPGYSQTPLQNGRRGEQDDRGGGAGETILDGDVGICLVVQGMTDEVRFTVNGKEVVVGKDVGPHVRLAR